MIPNCLLLDINQIEVLNKFLERYGGISEDCSGATSYTFHCYPTGLGDVIYVTCGKHTCHLGYDDDGKIIDEKL